MNNKSIAGITIILLTATISCSDSIAKATKQKAPKEVADWQNEQGLALEMEKDGHFEEAEKNFLKARKELLREFKNAPPSSFSARWFPLQNALRNLYLNRAVDLENSLPFAKVDECYKKALHIPGTTYEMWQQYADFLRRKGRPKQAEKVEQEGKKKSIYTTNQ